jgi:hypothetical protein
MVVSLGRAGGFPRSRGDGTLATWLISRDVDRSSNETAHGYYSLFGAGGRLNNNNTSGLRRGRARLEVIIELTHKLFAITFLGFCPIDGTNISTVPNASISPVNPAGEPKSDSNSSLQHPAINFAPSVGPDVVQISFWLNQPQRESRSIRLV